MPATVLLVGALDTKGVEYAFVKDLIEAAGLQTVVVDFGVMGQPAFAPDVSRGEVAAARRRRSGLSGCRHAQG